MVSESYIIRGGNQGYDRLKVLARVMHPTTVALLDRVGVGLGLRCLDVGCGSGDVCFELSRRVGATGRVVGVDLDEVKLDLGRREVAAMGLGNVVLRHGDATELPAGERFDVIYSRFVLTHLVDAAGAIASWLRLLEPGGVLVLEDMDSSAMFCQPPNAAYSRMIELYDGAVLARGADPHIGPKLLGMLAKAELTELGVNVVQPAGVEGEVKLIPVLTAENIRDAVLASELATPGELDALEAELARLGRDSCTLMSMTRVVQAWGRRSR